MAVLFFTTDLVFSATHTSTAELTPEWTDGNVLVNFDVEICNNVTSEDPVDEIRIYKHSEYTGVTCDDEAGWDKYLIAGFCLYISEDNSTRIDPGECVTFDFSATTPSTDGVRTWQFETRDIDEEWHPIYDTTTVDETPPETVKTYGSPFYENETSEWINDNTTITLNPDDGNGIDNSITKYRVTMVYDGEEGYDYCQDVQCPEAQGNGDFLNYSNPFTIPEESCHLIEFYSVDQLGNEEETKRQCAYVDLTPPDTFKVVQEPKIIPENDLEDLGEGDASWHPYSNTFEPSLGAYSAELVIPDNPSSGDFAGVDSFFDVFFELDDITSLTYDKKVTQYDSSGWNPLFLLGIDVDNDGLFEAFPLEWEAALGSGLPNVSLLGDDSFVQCESETGLSGTDISFVNIDAYNTFKCYTPNVAGNNYEGTYQSLSYFQNNAVGRVSPISKVAMLKVHLGGNPPTQDDEIAFVDNVRLNGNLVINDPVISINSETDVELHCEDQEPHPTPFENIWYRYRFTEDGVVWSEWLPGELCEEEHKEGGWCDWRTTKIVNFNESSLHELQWYCEDALHQTTQTDIEYFKVDNEPPVINKTMFGTYQGQCPPQNETDVCYVADDGYSGVSVFVEDPFPVHASNNIYCSYEVEWNNEVYRDEFSDYVNITFRGDSEHELIITCRDALGNSVEDVEVFLVDSEPPQTNKEYGIPYYRNEDSEWITSNTTINLTAWDEKIGVNETKYRITLVEENENCREIQCEAEGEGNFSTYSNPFTIPEQSCHLIEYYSTDLFGNAENIKKQCAYVDLTSPNGTKIVGYPSVPGNGSICEINQSNGGGGGGGNGGGDNSPGDVIHQLNVSGFDFPGYTNYCSVGLAFDGENLHYNRCSDPKIYEVDPINGDLIDTFNTAGLITGYPNAMAYDSSRNGMWFGTQSCYGSPRKMPIYFWDFDDDSVTLIFEVPETLINPATGNDFLGVCFLDGLAFNANGPGEADDELWFSDDVNKNLGVFMTNGTLITGYDATTVDPSLSKLSGLAIGGQNLYMGNDGGSPLGNSSVFRADKDILGFIDIFASDDERLEDMECDPNTFAPKEVMWVRHTPQGVAVDDLITAFEIESGTCGLGGEPPEPVECENETGIDWYVNQSTPITLSCEDQLPHPVNNEIVNWRLSFHNNSNWTYSQWYSSEEGGAQVSFGEDSIHDLEYYCTDALGNENEIDREIFAVDTIPPVITKEVVGPQVGECPPEEEGDECIIDGVTEIHVNAEDLEPHPVGNVTCDYSYSVDNNETAYREYHDVNPPFVINFPEQSTHHLDITCRDGLGNSERDYKIFKVDKTPPVTNKTYGTPFYENETSEWISNNTQVILSAYDPEPHPSGVNVTLWRNTLVDDEACRNEQVCQSAQGYGEWNTYLHPFYKPNQSCHLIEYYSRDNVNKTETVKKQCAFVDLTPPTPLKTVGEPKTQWGGENTFYPNLTERCWSGDPEEFLECWKVTLDTPISMSCNDPQPHPVGNENICFKVELDALNATEQYCESYQGQLNENGFCCLLTTIDDFKFTETSQHELEFYCEDKLGNKGPLDIEKFKVEGESFNITINRKWNLISVPVVLLNDSIDGVLGGYDFIESVWAYDPLHDLCDDDWCVYTPDGNDLNDDLHELTPGYGYWLLATDDGEIIIGGSLFSPQVVPPSRELVEGWNLIGYYGTERLPGYYGPFENQTGQSIDPYGEGDSSFCALNSLTLPGFIGRTPEWSSLESYWEPYNPGFIGLGCSQHMAPGAGYWIQMDAEDLYAPATVCEGLTPFSCLFSPLP